MGDLDTEHPWAARLAAGSGAVVISVDYRLAPENPYPAALNDAYAVLTWTAEHAAELGIDPERTAVGGHSAGAGLAAAVALRARDQQGPPIRYQLLNQPGLEVRTAASDDPSHPAAGSAARRTALRYQLIDQLGGGGDPGRHSRRDPVRRPVTR